MSKQIISISTIDDNFQIKSYWANFIAEFGNHNILEFENTLRREWKAGVYNRNSDGFFQIEFETEQDKMWFLLRWS